MAMVYDTILVMLNVIFVGVAIKTFGSFVGISCSTTIWMVVGNVGKIKGSRLVKTQSFNSERFLRALCLLCLLNDSLSLCGKFRSTRLIEQVCS